VTHEPGRRFPAIASPVASTRSVSEPHVPSPSYLHWARRLAAGTPASKPCSPRESVLRRPLRLARLRPPVGALLGFLPSRALSTTVLGLVSRVDARREPKPHATCTSGCPAVAVAFRDPDSDAWVREPRIRRYAESIELRASPSSGGPAHPAPRERRARQPPAPTHALADVRPERLARAPSRRHPAPPCPSRPDPPRGRRTLDLEDALASNRLHSPAPREAGRRAHPLRNALLSPVSG